MDPKEKKPLKPAKPAANKPSASNEVAKTPKPTPAAKPTAKPTAAKPTSKPTAAKPAPKPTAAARPAKTVGKPKPAPATTPTTTKTGGSFGTKKATLQQSRDQQKAKQQQWNAKRIGGARPAVAASLDQEAQTKLQGLQSEFDNLQDDIMLASVYDDMGRVEGTLMGLTSDLEALRMQNYVFGSFLENKISVLADKWEQVSEGVDDEVNRLSDDLAGEADESERFLRLALGGNRAMVGRAEASVRSLTSKASSARQAVASRYGDVAQNIQGTREQLDQIKWAFEQANEACFDFLQGEALVAASKAKLLKERGSDEGMEGVLYLTDGRLLFEQKEKVVTRKILFITTASEQVQECKLTALVGSVEKVEAEDARKLLSSRDLLHLQFAREAPVDAASFQLLDGAKNEAWVQLINRVRVGEIERERVATAAEEKATLNEQTQQAPTICPTCGAVLPTEIVRGQTTITCDYCNTVIRL